ncbi:MAG: hypothetical protein E7547_02795 [Ruminococcaceae bacterium]|nr:hypothetical protein [Oscillospiraceae bacterium]
MSSNNKLSAICRKCFYRRCDRSDKFYNGNSRWDSRCAYLELTGELRGCTPTDSECAKFKPRTSTKSLTGKRQMIK